MAPLGKYESMEAAKRSGTPENPAAEYTAEEAIEAMKWGRFQLTMLLFSGLFVVVEAFEVMLLTVLFPVVQCEWQLSSLQSALLAMVVFTGMLCGAPLWGVLSDRYGRKPVAYIATALVAYTGFLCTFSPNVSSLFILRFIVGAAISGEIQIAVLMVEYIGSKYRAITIVAQQGFWAVGALLEVLLAWQIIPTIGWRYLVGISALPVALSLLTWPAVPESVRFLLVSGQTDKAAKTLARVAETNGCKLPPGELRAEVVEERGRVADLFRPDYRRTTLQATFIWTTVTAIYYGTSLATTELLSINYCAAPGATAAVDRPSTDDCGCTLLSSSDYGHVAVTSVAELFSAYTIHALTRGCPVVMPVSILLADVIGRRLALAMCQVLVAIPFFVLLTCVGSTWGVTALLFLARGFAASASIILYLYTPEVYPTRCRAIGLSSCFIAGRIGAMLTPLLSQVLLRTSVHAALLVYGTISLAGAVVSFLLPIETKGRRME